MNNVKELRDENMAETIQQGVALVDFWAPWCGPCQIQGPILEQVAAKVGGKATIGKVNVDEAGQAAAAYGIRSIPTLIVFKDGKPVHQFVGVQSEKQLLAAIELALSK
jgi:thioredoxin 1